MTSFVYAEKTAHCPFSIATEFALHFLERSGARSGSTPVRVPLAAFGLPGTQALERNVALTFLVRYHVYGGVRGPNEIHYHWNAGSRFFPDLAGVLRLSIATPDRTKIVLSGTYKPPFGLLGRFFDAAIGRHWATATATDLVERLGRDLEVQEEAFRATHAVSA
jgi:hypothetical protein